MSDPNENHVLRFTDEGLATMRTMAKERPELWQSPDTDFHQIMVEEYHFPDYAETVPGATARGVISIPSATNGQPRQRLDLAALDFLDHLPGLTPTHLADPNLLAWLSCLKLLPYGIVRWPAPANPDRLAEHIRQHYLPHGGREITDASVAGRTLWLAHLARRAASAAAGAYTEKQALEHFARQPEHYHNCTGYNVMRSDLVLAEYVRVIMQEGRDASREDARGIARAANRVAGACILDAMPRAAIRQTMTRAASRLAQARQKRNVNVLSLGAGVQSTVMALMAEQGYEGMPKPDFAIFADTGWEPRGVYTHLKWLETQLSYPVVRVNNGNIRESILTGHNPEGRKFIDMPVYVIKPDGKKYVGTRQCTKLYKIRPIQRYLRDEYLKVKPGEPVRNALVHMWLGISRDEAARCKPSQVPWIVNTYPLLDRDYSRRQLEKWFGERYPERTLPKSACIGCPYHSDVTWARMKAEDPESWTDAVGIDWALRNVPAAQGSIEGIAYLHRSRTPLETVHFSETSGAGNYHQNDQQEECEGICGI